MSSAKHTPTPWVAEPDGSVFGRHPETGKPAMVRAGMDGTTEYRARMLADADFIVRACNVHDDLVEALQQVKAAIGDRLLAGGPLSEPYAHGVFRQINAALARAKDR